jgi:hypothetical protein
MKNLVFYTLIMLNVCLSGISCNAQEIKRRLVLPNYYLTAYLNTTDYEIFYPKTPNVGGTGPWVLAVGQQLTPRWAVQIGYAFQHIGTRDTYAGTTLTGQQIDGWRSSDTWTHAVPFTVRYTLIPASLSRLQLDIIGGGSWVSSRFLVAGEEFIDGKSPGIVSSEDHTKQWYLTAGIGVRYGFGRHFEGVFDYALLRNTQRVPEYIHLATVGNKLGLTRAISLGVRYQFHLKKQVD